MNDFRENMITASCLVLVSVRPAAAQAGAATPTNVTMARVETRLAGAMSDARLTREPVALPAAE